MKTEKRKKRESKKDLLERLHKETGLSHALLFYAIKFGMYL